VISLRRFVLASLLVVRIVLSSPSAAAARIPVVVRSVAAIGPTVTTHAESTVLVRRWGQEAGATAYDEEVVGHHPWINPLLIKVPRLVVTEAYGYDDRINFADGRAVPAFGAIYAKLVDRGPSAWLEEVSANLKKSLAALKQE
jgi:hypothetical protein